MKCYNKVNGKYCIRCCWGLPNNIFYYFSVVFKKIFNTKLLMMISDRNPLTNV